MPSCVMFPPSAGNAPANLGTFDGLLTYIGRSLTSGNYLHDIKFFDTNSESAEFISGAQELAKHDCWKIPCFNVELKKPNLPLASMRVIEDISSITGMSFVSVSEGKKRYFDFEKICTFTEEQSCLMMKRINLQIFVDELDYSYDSGGDLKFKVMYASMLDLLKQIDELDSLECKEISIENTLAMLSAYTEAVEHNKFISSDAYRDFKAYASEAKGAASRALQAVGVAMLVIGAIIASQGLILAAVGLGALGLFAGVVGTSVTQEAAAINHVTTVIEFGV
ncbi:MAG: hypothetical protein P1U39_00275 [Legionellaceae bacterium]|nr:hypothetical protein [Legionellaceae bacterium]